MNWIEVPVVSKKGVSLDYHLINLNNVLYFREWVEDTPITIDNKGKVVAYVIGGKDVIINLPLHKIYELIGDNKAWIRNNELLERVKEADKETS